MIELLLAIANAGIVLQIDCPDLGMGRHIQHADLSLPEWRKKAELHVEALDPHAPDAIGQVADRDELEYAFRRLDPEQRALIVLHYYLGLPVSETAEVLRLPVGTIKSRLHRTTQAMRAQASIPSGCCSSNRRAPAGVSPWAA